MTESGRIFEYFVTCGLSDTDDVEELAPGAQECGFRETVPQAPITDICVIFPSLGEEVPDGFTMVETTPTGFPADLNHNSIRTHSCYLCYRRGHHKPPLVDIGVMYDDKEKIAPDCQVVRTTPNSRVANVNNSQSLQIFLTFRRAPETAAASQLAVTDICVILTNKGESPPHTFCKISKNLNRGLLTGSDVFICYKKSINASHRVAYKPSLLDRYPTEDNPDCPLPSRVALFCLPMGAVIECWPEKCQAPSKVFLTFVLTDERGRKFYGAAVSFFEQSSRELTEEQLENLGCNEETMATGSVSDSSSTNDPTETKRFYQNKSICIISRYPFFAAFKRYLFFLQRMSNSGSHKQPIERYISHLMYEVPFPSLRRPFVSVKIGSETISFDNPEASPLPMSGANFMSFLSTLNVDNAMYLMLLALTEQKILLHSLRPAILTDAAETLAAIVFPFRWQCPYIPQLPLDLAGVLHAPMPFLAGVDSRYFEMYEDPPSDVTCIDLDTNTISTSEIRQKLKLSILPRKAAKILRQSLENCYKKIVQKEWNSRIERKTESMVPLEEEHRNSKMKRQIELEIQEAFLRFMGMLLKGYSQYLKPMRSAPSVGSTDTYALFDIGSFSKSRDKSGHEFFKLMLQTQCFIRFIEERSFSADKDPYMIFFDDIISRVDTTEPLIELDLNLENSDYTVVIPDPENMYASDAANVFEYNGVFPSCLDPDKFNIDIIGAKKQTDQLHSKSVHGILHQAGKNMYKNRLLDKFELTNDHGQIGNSPAARRSKQETRTAQKIARQQTTSPVRWAKCLLSYAYSIWFIYLPAYVRQNTARSKAYLRMAFSVLDRMQNARLPVMDEVCYRVVMQLCHVYDQPLMILKVYVEMLSQGIHPNAITYAVYNRTILEAKWPSKRAEKAYLAWRKLQLALKAIVILKKGLKERRLRMKKIAAQSQGSVDSGQQSRTHSDNPETISVTSKHESIVEGIEDKHCSDLDFNCNSDVGYNSMMTNDNVATVSSNANLAVQHCDIESLEHFIKKRQSRVVKHRSFTTMAQLGAMNIDSAAGVLMTTDAALVKLLSRNEAAASAAEVLESTSSSHVTELHQQIVSSDHDDLDPLGALSSNTICRSDVIATSALTLKSTSPAKEAAVATVAEKRLFEEFHSSSDSDSKNASHDDLSSEQGLLTDPATPLTPTGMGSMMNQAGSGVKSLWSRFGTPAMTHIMRSKTIDGSLNRDTPGSLAEPLTPSGTEPNSPSFLHDISEDVDSADSGIPPNQLPSTPKSSTMMIPGTPASSMAVASWQKRIGGFARQTGSMRSIRSSVSSVMSKFGSQVSRSINLDSAMTSPLKSSLSSLDFTPLSMSRYGIDDSHSIKDEDARSLLYDDEYQGEDPAFQLSSGETGSLINFEMTATTKLYRKRTPVTINRSQFDLNKGMSGSLPAIQESLNRDENTVTCTKLEVTLSNCSKCTSCSLLVYDEEIMSGWSADDSDLNTRCVFCGERFVPMLTVHVGRVVLEAQPIAALRPATAFGGSMHSMVTTPGPFPAVVGETPKKMASIRRQIARAKFKSNECITSATGEVRSDVDGAGTVESKESETVAEAVISVPFISHLILRKELENLILVGSESILSSPLFVLEHPILFWNMLFCFQRLAVPSFLHKMITDDRVLKEIFVSCIEKKGLEFWSTLPALNGEDVSVRCAFEAWTNTNGQPSVSSLHAQYHTDQLNMKKNANVQSDDPDDVMGARSMLVHALIDDTNGSRGAKAGSVVLSKIVEHLGSSSIHRSLQLLLQEYSKRSTASNQVGASLPLHESMYRELLFISLLAYGGDNVDIDAFDKEYTLALKKLPPKIQTILQPNDKAPAPGIRACRKILMPLDVI